MPSFAAAATDTAGLSAALLGFAFLGIAVVTLGYLAGCWFWPFGVCRACQGSGKRRSPSGRSFRLCRRCDGDGRRLRFGRRVINAARDLHDNAS